MKVKQLSHRFGCFRIGIYFAKTEYYVGVTSRCEDKKHVIFWDFESGKPLLAVINALRDVQKRFGLGDIFVFGSGDRNSFRAVCFEKMDWKKAIRIVCMTDHVDFAFIRFSLQRYSFTLRLSPKTIKGEPEEIKFICKIPSLDLNQREISWEHVKVFGLTDRVTTGKVRMVIYEGVNWWK